MPDQMQDPKRPDSASWKFTDAKAQLSLVVQKALEGEPQRIVRGGRDVVVVVAEAAYKEATQPRRSLVDLFSSLRGSGLNLEREDDDFGREVDL